MASYSPDVDKRRGLLLVLVALIIGGDTATRGMPYGTSLIVTAVFAVFVVLLWGFFVGRGP
jgi:hypothetical protein